MPTLLRNFGRWISKQIKGFGRNFVGLFTTSPGTWLPPSVWSTVVWLKKAIGWAFGSSTPIKQITAATSLAIFAILASWITLGTTLVIALILAIFAVLGVLRLVPVFNRVWVDARGAIVP